MRETEEKCMQILVVNLKETDHFEDLGRWEDIGVFDYLSNY
jgi:hypothetical protein